MRPAHRELVDRVQAATRGHDDSRVVRRRALDVLGRVVPFDAFAWLLTDPETMVGVDPLAVVPCLPELPTLIRLRYQAPNRWTTLTGVATLAGAQESEWGEFLAGYGVHDVATVVLADRYGCWGFLDLWRGTAFTGAEVATLDALRPVATAALRRCRAAAFAGAPAGPAPGGPAVLLLSPALEVRRQTAESEALQRRLLPTAAERRPIPAGAYNVAAQLLAVEAGVDDHPARARVALAGGRWVSLQASRLAGGPDADIAVTVEPVPASERLGIFARAHGLSPRETEVLRCLSDGDDTRTAAARLHLSELTLQDHVKTICAKTGASGRRALLARAVG